MPDFSNWLLSYQNSQLEITGVKIGAVTATIRSVRENTAVNGGIFEKSD